MLAKLLKYDLRYIYKVLGIYYAIVILLVLIFLVTDVDNPNGIIDFLHVFAGGAGFGLSIGLTVNAITRGWVRFQKNFYGEEAYLTHTLPISKTKLLLSKFISSFIVLAISLVLFAFCTIVTQFNGAFDFGEIDNFLKSQGSSLLGFGSLLFTTILLQYFFITECGFVGILTGHRKDEHRVLWSWVFGVGIYMIVTTLMVEVLLLWGQFDSNIQDFIFSGSSESLFSIENLRKIILGVNAIYAATIIALYFIGQKTLNRGVDVE